MIHTATSMKNTTATTTLRRSALSHEDFYRRVKAQAVKEVRIRTLSYGFLTAYDRDILRDMIVTKAFQYYEVYDPAKCNVEGIVYRIAHNTVCDYVNAWMHRERHTRSLDRMLGWTGDSQDDSESYTAPKAFAQKAAERFRDYEAESDHEMTEWASHVRRVLRTLSAGDQRVIAMLEQEMTRDEMAAELGCTRDALDKRVFDTRRRVQKALGCKVVKSRKAHRETADSMSVDLPVLLLCA